MSSLPFDFVVLFYGFIIAFIPVFFLLYSYYNLMLDQMFVNDIFICSSCKNNMW